MNIKELKEKIKDLPDLMDVFLDKDDGEFSLQLLERAEVKDCKFTGDGVQTTREKCLVLTDEI